VIHRREVHQHVRQCPDRPELFERLVPCSNKYNSFHSELVKTRPDIKQYFWSNSLAITKMVQTLLFCDS
jgi:hypothetical protein